MTSLKALGKEESWSRGEVTSNREAELFVVVELEKHGTDVDAGATMLERAIKPEGITRMSQVLEM